MPRPRKQPIKAGDEIARGAKAVPHDPGGRYIGKMAIGGLGDPVPAPAHPCWKYRVLRSDEGSYWWLDGESAIVNEVFAKMGALGWELVTIYPVGDAIHAPIYYAVFKREVRDG